MREEAMKLEKVKKSSKITATVAKVLEVMLIVGTLVCIAGAIICFCMNDQINEGYEQIISTDQDAMELTKAMDQIEVGGVLSFSVTTEKLIAEGQYGQAAGIMCLAGALVCAMVAAVFAIIKRIFQTINVSETPFDEKVLVKIKRLFIIISIELLLMVGVLEAALTALVCWSIYNILDYGFTLQKQYDETL